MDTFDAMMQRGGGAAIRTAGRFFMKDRLNPYVWEKFDELWTAIQQSPPEE